MGLLGILIVLFKDSMDKKIHFRIRDSDCAWLLLKLPHDSF